MKVFEPLGGRILVHQTEAQKQTSAGIHLMPQMQERPNTGFVIMGTDSYRNKKMRTDEVPSGSEILFNRFAGVTHRIDGKEYLILRPEDVLGIISEIPDPVAEPTEESSSA